MTKTTTDDETTTPICACGQRADYTHPKPLCVYHWACWYVDNTSTLSDVRATRDQKVAACVSMFLGEAQNEVREEERKVAAENLGKVGAAMIQLFARWLAAIGEDEAGSCSGTSAADLAFNVRDGDFEAWLREKAPELVGAKPGGGGDSGSGG